MAVRIIWSPLARHDLKSAGAYIRKDNSSAAASFLWSVEEKVQLLTDFPELGRIVPEQNEPSLREIVYRSYRINYFHASKSSTIRIIRVWHAARGEPETKA